MKKNLYLFLTTFFLFNSLHIQAQGMSQQEIVRYYSDVMNEPGNITFTPPKGWHFSDPSIFRSRPHVKVVVVGKGSKDYYPPSINLGVEPLKGTVKEYLRQIKAENDALHDLTKDLGLTRTEAGNAQLVQVDMKTPSGEVRLMHALIEKQGMLYTLTVAALKDEFSRFYPDFFSTIRSLRFNTEASVQDP